MSTQQPLSVKTMLGIRAQIHIQWTSLRDRRHRSAHTEIRTHLTHTHKTNELPKLASRVEMFLFLQYLYLFIIFVCTCVCAYECVHHSIGPVGHCLTQPGAAIMKTLLRLPNWHSTPSHWLIGNSSKHTHTHMLMIHAEICWHIQSHTSLHTLCSWCLLCHLSSTCTHGDTHTCKHSFSHPEQNEDTHSHTKQHIWLDHSTAVPAADVPHTQGLDALLSALQANSR